MCPRLRWRSFIDGGSIHYKLSFSFLFCLGGKYWELYTVLLYSNLVSSALSWNCCISLTSPKKKKGWWLLLESWLEVPQWTFTQISWLKRIFVEINSKYCIIKMLRRCFGCGRRLFTPGYKYQSHCASWLSSLVPPYSFLINF